MNTMTLEEAISHYEAIFKREKDMLAGYVARLLLEYKEAKERIKLLEEEAAMLACFCADLCPNKFREDSGIPCDDCPGMDCEDSDKPEAWRELARKNIRGE